MKRAIKQEIGFEIKNEEIFGQDPDAGARVKSNDNNYCHHF